MSNIVCPQCGKHESLQYVESTPTVFHALSMDGNKLTVEGTPTFFTEGLGDDPDGHIECRECDAEWDPAAFEVTLS